MALVTGDPGMPGAIDGGRRVTVLANTMEVGPCFCVSAVRMRRRELAGSDESERRQHHSGDVHHRGDGYVGLLDAKSESDARCEVGVARMRSLPKTNRCVYLDLRPIVE